MITTLNCSLNFDDYKSITIHQRLANNRYRRISLGVSHGNLSELEGLERAGQVHGLSVRLVHHDCALPLQRDHTPDVITESTGEEERQLARQLDGVVVSGEFLRVIQLTP